MKKAIKIDVLRSYVNARLAAKTTLEQRQELIKLLELAYVTLEEEHRRFQWSALPPSRVPVGERPGVVYEAYTGDVLEFPDDTRRYYW